MRWLAFTALICCCSGLGALDEIEPHKKVIGEIARFVIGDEALFLARIDTGAATTSVHAVELSVEDEHDDMRKNIGKTIHFVLVNEEGQRWPGSAVIRDVTKVRTSQGVERRYQVPLRIGWDTINKIVDVNLRDRSKMEYKLLVGRDWLAREVVVDLERNVLD